jgi:hypothetical protein
VTQSHGSTATRAETFEKCSFLFELKEGANFTHRNTLVFRGLKLDPDLEIGQKGALFKGLEP